MRLIFIRHGDPDYVRDSLTEKGWREADCLAERVARWDVTRVYCSPLGRARDTASRSLEKLGMEAEILPWLEEFSLPVPDPAGGTRIPWDLFPSEWTREEQMFDRNRFVEAPQYASSPLPPGIRSRMRRAGRAAGGAWLCAGRGLLPGSAPQWGYSGILLPFRHHHDSDGASAESVSSTPVAWDVYGAHRGHHSGVGGAARGRGILPLSGYGGYSTPYRCRRTGFPFRVFYGRIFKVGAGWNFTKNYRSCESSGA